jgi:TldD protein
VGDAADQPISANGLPRETVAIVDGGVLASGLGDLFSAEQAGIPVTGACRAASFRDRPTPRMTNIRVVLREPLPLAVDPEDLTAEMVAQTLRAFGFVERGTRTLYLAGYRGGQAHPRRGDFIFAANAVYEIEGERAVPRRAASFTGLAEPALAAIVAGIGPLRLDALGACGKDGSTVPSSGGSHALLVLDPDPALAVSAAS